VLGDHDPFWIEVVQESQTLFFELRCVDLLHG
jgi:hypothetical protein